MPGIISRVFGSLLFAVAIAGAVASGAQAQKDTGNASITGHVKDPQGANLPGAVPPIKLAPSTETPNLLLPRAVLPSAAEIGRASCRERV